MNKIKLYSNCKVSKGFIRSIIIDLQREIFFFAPNNIGYIFDGLTEHNASDETLNSNISFLLQNKLAFIAGFPFNSKSTLSKTINCYSDISNLTLILDNIRDPEYIQSLFDQVNINQCNALLIISAPPINIAEVEKVLKLLNHSKIRSVQIITKYPHEGTFAAEEQMIHTYKRVVSILYYDAPLNQASNVGVYEQVLKITSTITFDMVVNRPVQAHHFICNIPFFNESLAYNPFYYKKAVVNVDGQVFVALHSNEAIGDVKKRNLAEIINDKTLFEFAFTSKIKIDVCKRCEFKNICPDNRVPNKRPNGSWYHDTECDYNPFIAKWKNENGYQTLSDCGIICNETGFKIDRKRLKIINHLLWKC